MVTSESESSSHGSDDSELSLSYAAARFLSYTCTSVIILYQHFVQPFKFVLSYPAISTYLPQHTRLRFPKWIT
eukprot:2305465-Rhodomonas_salina.1